MSSNAAVTEGTRMEVEVELQLLLVGLGECQTEEK